MAQIDSSYTTYCWSSIVSIALSCTIFELLDVGQLNFPCMKTDYGKLPTELWSPEISLDVFKARLNTSVAAAAAAAGSSLTKQPHH